MNPNHVSPDWLSRPLVVGHAPDAPLDLVPVLPELDALPRLVVELVDKQCSWCGTSIPSGRARWANLWVGDGICRLHMSCHVAAETITPSGEWRGRPLDDVEDDQLVRVWDDMPNRLLHEWRTVLAALNISEPPGRP